MPKHEKLLWIGFGKFVTIRGRGFGKRLLEGGMFDFLNCRKADFEKAEQLAWETLVKSGFNRPPVIAVEIADQKGLKVEITHFKKEYRQKVAGFIDPGSGIIVVNAEDSISRRNFTVAHELGHVVLGHDIESPEYSVLFRNSEKQKYKSPMEQEADCFAANLLVPMSMLRECLENYPFALDQQLAQIFGVSAEVIKWRRKYI